MRLPSSPVASPSQQRRARLYEYARSGHDVQRGLAATSTSRDRELGGQSTRNTLQGIGQVERLVEIVVHV